MYCGDVFVVYIVVLVLMSNFLVDVLFVGNLLMLMFVLMVMCFLLNLSVLVIMIWMCDVILLIIVGECIFEISMMNLLLFSCVIMLLLCSIWFNCFVIVMSVWLLVECLCWLLICLKWLRLMNIIVSFLCIVVVCWIVVLRCFMNSRWFGRFVSGLWLVRCVSFCCFVCSIVICV